ncbi:hypothetical protein BK750_32320 [Bacillus thuringiensis serovar jegathesan]|uniref:Uncharacterized protein n=1 Tax=Bacillus thuringiensis subsp. jegathesan TaxID=56955 RepID=A0A9X6LUF2_BACTJ|nr:hypothetical protein BK750_32320 [Bacillus thuringiensis serovar jegathesan]
MFMKNEQKIPNGMELYAVKPKVAWIRYICFWTDFSPGKVYPFLTIYMASIPAIIFVAVRNDLNPSIFELHPNC